jgi:hypothetical protein
MSRSYTSSPPSASVACSGTALAFFSDTRVGNLSALLQVTVIFTFTGNQHPTLLHLTPLYVLCLFPCPPHPSITFNQATVHVIGACFSHQF